MDNNFCENNERHKTKQETIDGLKQHNALRFEITIIKTKEINISNLNEHQF